MNFLSENGYIVLPVFPVNKPDGLPFYEDNFLKTALQSPELKSNMEHTRFVLGGVGYVPFASLWYSEIARCIAREVYHKVLEQNPFEIDENKYFCMLPDRPLIRFPGQVVAEKGKWHQDDAANSVDGTDLIYGGWVNLNRDVTQYFKAIPGTHNPNHPIFNALEQKNGGKRGYSDFKSKKDQTYLTNYWKNEVKKLIEIPPGHVLIFQEHLIHTVFPNPPIDKPLLRLHTSFNISSSEIPLHDRPTQPKHQKKRKIKALFEDQEMIPVRSGQHTPLYSPFHLFPNSVHALDELSSHYIECCKQNGRVKRFLPSMKEMSTKGGLEMRRKMDENEMLYYLPHKLQDGPAETI
jgi:hypothetical protein